MLWIDMHRGGESKQPTAAPPWSYASYASVVKNSNATPVAAAVATRLAASSSSRVLSSPSPVLLSMKNVNGVNGALPRTRGEPPSLARKKKKDGHHPPSRLASINPRVPPRVNLLLQESQIQQSRVRKVKLLFASPRVCSIDLAKELPDTGWMYVSEKSPMFTAHKHLLRTSTSDRKETKSSDGDDAKLTTVFGQCRTQPFVMFTDPDRGQYLSSLLRTYDENRGHHWAQSTSSSSLSSSSSPAFNSGRPPGFIAVIDDYGAHVAFIPSWRGQSASPTSAFVTSREEKTREHSEVDEITTTNSDRTSITSTPSVQPVAAAAIATRPVHQSAHKSASSRPPSSSSSPPIPSHGHGLIRPPSLSFKSVSTHRLDDLHASKPLAMISHVRPFSLSASSSLNHMSMMMDKPNIHHISAAMSIPAISLSAPIPTPSAPPSFSAVASSSPSPSVSLSSDKSSSSSSTTEKTLSPFAPAVSSTTPKDTAVRHALVIGNNAYKKVPLTNAVNDARAITEALKYHGWQVYAPPPSESGQTRECFDLQNSEMRAAFNDWVTYCVRAGDIVLFYFAGHGVQSRNHQRIFGIDTDTMAPQAIPDGLVLTDIQEALSKKKVGYFVCILDCCRVIPKGEAIRGDDDLFQKNVANCMMGAASTVTQALAYPNMQSYHAMACSLGAAAQDGNKISRNGLFTFHLKNYFALPTDLVTTTAVHDTAVASGDNDERPHDFVQDDIDIVFSSIRNDVQKVATPTAPSTNNTNTIDDDDSDDDYDGTNANGSKRTVPQITWSYHSLVKRPFILCPPWYRQNPNRHMPTLAASFKKVDLIDDPINLAS